MRTHSRRKGVPAEEPLDPQDLWAWLGVVIFIWQEKFPHLTQEEVFAQVKEALASSRVRHWLPRLGTSLSLAEMNEMDSRVKEMITKRRDSLLDWLQDAVEIFVLGLRFATSPYQVRLRTRLLKQRKKKQVRDARAGRHRNNKQAAEYLVELFQQQKEALIRIQKRPPQVAAREAVDYVVRYLQTASRAKDRQAVLTFFKDLLQKDQQR